MRIVQAVQKGRFMMRNVIASIFASLALAACGSSQEVPPITVAPPSLPYQFITWRCDRTHCDDDKTVRQIIAHNSLHARILKKQKASGTPRQ